MLSYEVLKVGDQAKLLISKKLESIDLLQKNLNLSPACQTRFNKIQSDTKKQQFLTARMLLKKSDLTPENLYYSPNGKPLLKNGPYISISHSKTYVGVLIGADYPLGLDIETITPRINNVAPRFCHANELKFLNEEDTTRKTIIWCAKEAIYKLYDIPGIDFREHIQVNAFKTTDQKISILFQKGANTHLGSFKLFENHVVTWVV